MIDIHAPPGHPALSCAIDPDCPVDKLGDMIARLIRAYHAADEYTTKHHRSIQRDPQFRGLETHLNRRQDAAVEMISYERARSRRGGLTQIILAAADLTHIEAMTDDSDVQALCARALRNVYSALKVVAPGVEPEPTLRDYWMPDYLDEVGRMLPRPAQRAA